MPSLRESPKQAEQAPLSRTIGGFNGIRRARARSNYLIASGYRLSAAPTGRAEWNAVFFVIRRCPRGMQGSQAHGRIAIGPNYCDIHPMNFGSKSRNGYTVATLRDPQLGPRQARAASIGSPTQRRLG